MVPELIYGQRPYIWWLVIQNRCHSSSWHIHPPIELAIPTEILTLCPKKFLPKQDLPFASRGFYFCKMDVTLFTPDIPVEPQA